MIIVQLYQVFLIYHCSRYKLFIIHMIKFNFSHWIRKKFKEMRHNITNFIIHLDYILYYLVKIDFLRITFIKLL